MANLVMETRHVHSCVSDFFIHLFFYFIFSQFLLLLVISGTKQSQRDLELLCPVLEQCTFIFQTAVLITVCCEATVNLLSAHAEASAFSLLLDRINPLNKALS